MASSSHSNNHQSFKDKVSKIAQEIEEEEDEEEEEEEEEEEDEEWLQLKLGVGSGGTSCSKRVGHDQSNPESRSGSLGLGLELGLGLGLELWPNIEEKEGMLEWSRFIGRVPSWQMDSQHWFMPIPVDSHHCCHTNPHVSGLWFTLHSSTNRKGEALPQIPKAYIRVKNENMTIFMVKKYLVTKLGLSNENEVDVLCMGQSLMDVQSLRHVRDSIWIPALIDSLNSTSKSVQDFRDMFTTNLMPLLYQKYPILNN